MTRPYMSLSELAERLRCSVTPRCHICRESIPREDRGRLVALRNGIRYPACFAHWFMWPDDHKTNRVEELVRVLQETAP